MVDYSLKEWSTFMIYNLQSFFTKHTIAVQIPNRVFFNKKKKKKAIIMQISLHYSPKITQ